MAFTWTPEDGTLAAADDAARSARYASPRNWIISGMSLSAGTGLNVAVSAGSAWIAGYYVEWDAAAEQAVTASNTNYVYVELSRDGNGNVTGVAFVVNTTGTPPSGDHIVLGTATADGSSVTGTATTGRSAENQGVTSVFGRDGAVAAAAGDYDADQVDYDNTTSGMTATDVQDAIDELAARPASGGWTGIAAESANRTRVSTTTFTSDNLLFSGVAGKAYVFEIKFMIQGNVAGVATKVTIAAPSGSTGDWQITALTDQGTTAALIQFGNAFGASVQIAGSGYKNSVVIQGYILIGGTTGNVAFQWAQQSSNANPMTIYKGATLKWKDIT